MWEPGAFWCCLYVKHSEEAPHFSLLSLVNKTQNSYKNITFSWKSKNAYWQDILKLLHQSCQVPRRQTLFEKASLSFTICTSKKKFCYEQSMKRKSALWFLARNRKCTKRNTLVRTTRVTQPASSLKLEKQTHYRAWPLTTYW